jgi:flagellar protein FlgJ
MDGSTPTAPIDLFRTFSLESQKGQPVDRAKIVKLAQEFEAMLMLQMVRQMRQSVSFDDEQEKGLGNETMTDTFDVEFSRYLAKSGGIGLGGMIERQLSKQMDGASAPDASDLTDAAARASTAGVPAAIRTPASVIMPGPATTTPTMAAPIAASPTTPAATPSATVPAASGLAAAAATAAARSVTTASSLTMPLESGTTSGFGWRKDPLGHGRRFHAGVDLRAAYGTEVPAAASGDVTFSGDQGSYGTMVVVRHEDGFETRYAHLSSTEVQVGDRVEAGQAVGRVGSTGRSTGPHLHFEVRRHGQQVDPADVTGSQTPTFKFVSGVDDSLHERMLPGGTHVSLTDDPGADDEDPGRKAR